MRVVGLVLLCLLLAACGIQQIPGPGGGAAPAVVTGIQVTPAAGYQPDANCPDQVRAARAGNPNALLPERYRELRVIDAHNHGASDRSMRTVDLHDKYFIDLSRKKGLEGTREMNKREANELIFELGK
jgi:hypothetical protein